MPCARNLKPLIVFNYCTKYPLICCSLSPLTIQIYIFPVKYQPLHTVLQLSKGWVSGECPTPFKVLSLVKLHLIVCRFLLKAKIVAMTIWGPSFSPFILGNACFLWSSVCFALRGYLTILDSRTDDKRCCARLRRDEISMGAVTLEKSCILKLFRFYFFLIK
jgi:hypothetical protein